MIGEGDEVFHKSRHGIGRGGHVGGADRVDAIAAGQFCSARMTPPLSARRVPVRSTRLSSHTSSTVSREPATARARPSTSV